MVTKSIQRTSSLWRQVDEQDHPVPVLFCEKRLWMKDLLTFQDMIDSPRKLMCKNSQRLRLAVLPCEFVTVLYGFGVSPEERTAASEKAHFR